MSTIPLPRRLARALRWWLRIQGVAALAQAAVFMHTTLRGKFRSWARELDALDLVGDERVLDLGCGRGAVLIAVARRLPAGRVDGIDLWRSIDQSGNDPRPPGTTPTPPGSRRGWACTPPT